MSRPRRAPRAGDARADRQSKVQAWLDALKGAGLKLTPQRIAIIRVFADDPSHPTAQDLFERLRGDFPTMSFATVYNTLDALASRGLSGELNLGGAARFDPNTDTHHHAVCDACGAVVDIPADPVAPAQASQVRRATGGFVVEREERTYHGLCERCARSGAAAGDASRSRARARRAAPSH
ncbi:MAG: transcriptional repressor [Myxococcales bacterium]|nr:transcriptional repressor [Myxococcales bacterium]